jgi:sialate O-acetylesterase
MKYLKLLLLAAIAISCTKEPPVLELTPLFSDHMVLQQEKENPIWGIANPASEVEVSGSWGGKATAMADKNGKWMTKLATPKSGGPFQLTISRGDSVITLNDVYSGEVWLASGQSNMEMPLKGWTNNPIDNSEPEIAAADYPEIRMFTVKRNLSFTPLDTVSGSWKVATTQNAGDFSATAWFFAKKLNADTGVPIGIIHTSWGGTPAQAWTTAAYLDKVPTYEGTSKTLQGYAAYYDSVKTAFDKLEKTTIDLSASKPFANVSFDDSGFETPDFADSAWKSLNVPGLWESQWMGNFDGVAWLRKSFQLTAEQVASKSLELYLGSIDDMDITYVNGTKVGAIEETGKYQEARVYAIPDGLLKEGTNVVAVKVFDTAGGGGIYGSDDIGVRPTGSDKLLVSLKGEWKAKPVAESIFSGSVLPIARDILTPSEKPKMQLTAYSPTTLYNAMINPLVPYGIKGAIWYQGESNVGAAEVYRTLFPTMIKNWRDAWGLGNFPFYFVQIAPYKYGRNDDMAAQLRDAQTSTLSLENTGMAVIMDVGDPADIHPANKKDVGERLALWALAKDYGVGAEYSGPMYESMTIEGNKVSVSFSHADGLQFKGEPGFVEVAGADGNFVEAKAEISEGKLVASSVKVTRPTAIRYGWCEACEPNLFNGAGLPAIPFNSKTK